MYNFCASHIQVFQTEETRQEKASGKTAKPMPNTKSDGKLEFVQVDVLPAAGGSMCNGIKVFRKEEWQNKGIKKFTVTFNNEKLSKEAEYVNQHRGISVLTLDHELTNKAIISLRQNLIPNGRFPKCAIMCKDGQQLSGFFIGVNCMLDMVDKGNKINFTHGWNKFKSVCPDFEPSEEQLLQLSQLSKDYISYGKKSK
ncbi:hypothetical protein CAPTEDRAFT_191156 [Capitella teleta]|uniref:Uncharacterized protein n=1 Tax=Capitella teleta TaxID=283909 RepID=R7UX31_CAPTE|nr:hypothetical protein CAPTEDRAFT_191156 [Capitella teleta]|eukprot:ELU08472.1 hypothetical protein CAPTEDRAFT_191156 [Capitella teleta]